MALSKMLKYLLYVYVLVYTTPLITINHHYKHIDDVSSFVHSLFNGHIYIYIHLNLILYVSQHFQFVLILFNVSISVYVCVCARVLIICSLVFLSVASKINDYKYIRGFSYINPNMWLICHCS